MSEHTEVLTEPTPEPPKRSGGGGGKVLVAGILVLVLIVGAAVAATLVFSDNSHDISTPTSAGGMKRDTKREKMLESQLSAARKQFKTQLGGTKAVRSAVYLQDDSKRGPKGPLVFLGAELNKQRSSTDWINTFHKNATANGFKVTDTDAGDGGGKGVCAEQSASGQKVAICAWATEDSIGELIPTVPGYSASNLGSLMRDLRTDVES
jgi:hypothetical protein